MIRLSKVLMIACLSLLVLYAQINHFASLQGMDAAQWTFTSPEKTSSRILGYPLKAVAAAASSDSPIPLVSTCLNASTMGKSCGRPLPPFESSLSVCQSFRAVSGKPTQNLLQQVHFEQAMEEECWNMTGHSYNVDHRGARNKLDECAVGITFPRSLIAYCSCGVWNYNKSKNYFFSGFRNPERQHSWLMTYANESNSQVNFTFAGRRIRKDTGFYDYPYYDRLMSSRFALAPDGDFPWTYRFLEGIMCGAIPVVSKREKPEEQEVGYEYCEALQPCSFINDEEARQQAAQRNWLRFVRRHSLVTEFEEW